jgi:hypothetical protein
MKLEDWQVLASPSGFGRVEMGDELYGWQGAVMDALDPVGGGGLPVKVGLATPNESGKTSVVVRDLIFWHMTNFPGSLVVTISGSNLQIKQQLYPNIRKALTRFPNWTMRDSNVHEVAAPNGSLCVSFSTDDPGKAEGFHEMDLWANRGDRSLWKAAAGQMGLELGRDFVLPVEKSLLIVVDEAKSVADEIFTAIERCHPTRMLVASSPHHINPGGYFYDCFHVNSSHWKLFRVSHADCPHLQLPHKIREREEQIARWGLGAPLIRSMHFGEFPTQGEDMVFDMEKVDRAMSGMLPRWGQGERRGAVDLSGGKDSQVFMLRDGNELMHIEQWHISDVNALCQKLIETFRRWGLRPEQISGDNTGMGQPIIDVLSHKGWPINRIDFSAKPRSRMFLNVRSEMYVELANRIRLEEVRLIRNAELREELTWIAFERNSREQTGLRPKKGMAHSPNLADTLAMLYYDMPDAADMPHPDSDDRRLFKGSGDTDFWMDRVDTDAEPHYLY